MFQNNCQSGKFEKTTLFVAGKEKKRKEKKEKKKYIYIYILIYEWGRVHYSEKPAKEKKE